MSGADYRQQQGQLEREQQEVELRERVIELFEYDPESGKFRRKVKCGHQSVGVIAGTLANTGYVRIKIDGIQHSAHRLAWLLTYKDWPDGDIDHINGDKSDNRIANLRNVTHAQNRQNSRLPYANNTSGAPGVSWHKSTSKWQSRILVNGEYKHLGLFTDLQAASDAYLNAKQKFHPIATLGD